MWLFDTVALSELRKPQPNAGFMAWLETIVESDFHTSVICLGEVRRGVVMLPPGEKRDGFTRWLEHELPETLGRRVLPVDNDVAQAWGRLGGRGKMAVADALIGCTAVVNRLVVVTRNVRDFDGLGAAVLNPWS